MKRDISSDLFYFAVLFDSSLLLSQKGVELPKLSQRLEALNAAKSFDPIEPVGDTDIQVIIITISLVCISGLRC